MLRKYIVGLAGAGLAVGASTGIAVAANGSPPANAPSATHSARPAAVRGITGTTAQAPETSTTVPDGHDAANHDAANQAADHDAADHDAADHDAPDHDTPTPPTTTPPTTTPPTTNTNTPAPPSRAPPSP